jgi:carboxyl-terminal processing protease
MNTIKNKYNKNLLLILIILLVFSLGYLSGYQIYSHKLKKIFFSNPNIEIGQQTNLFQVGVVNEVVENLENFYIDKDLDYKKMEYGMAEGIIESLDDKYTIFLNPEENKEYKDNRSPELEGIGVVLTFNGEFTQVESVLDGYPALLEGLQAGDIVLEVNDEEMSSQKPEVVSSKIKGKSGTLVKLKLLRPESGEVLTKNIERTTIKIDNISYKKVEEGIYNIRINRFIDDSSSEFNSKWDDIAKEVCSTSSNKLIIDLRYNPGGYVDSALYLLEDFLPRQSLLMNEVDRDGKSYPRNSLRDPRCADNKMVVLLNTSSASASEIFAGALKDYKRAVLIGQNTVGKGLEQTVVDLSDGSAIHIVFRKWTTPLGFNPTAEDPIKPDILIELPENSESSDFDREGWEKSFMDSALESLKN